MRNRRPIRNPYTSPFLGIGVGKKKEAEAAATIKKIEAETAAALELEKQKQQSLLLQLEAAKQGYDPEAAAREQAIQVEEIKAQPEQTMYVIIAVVVVAVMIGLYFIKRK